jgi:hypothetical protein
MGFSPGNVTQTKSPCRGVRIESRLTKVIFGKRPGTRPPLQGGSSGGAFPGLKPWAMLCSPCGRRNPGRFPDNWSRSRAVSGSSGVWRRPPSTGVWTFSGAYFIRLKGEDSTAQGFSPGKVPPNEIALQGRPNRVAIDEGYLREKAGQSAAPAPNSKTG